MKMIYGGVPVNSLKVKHYELDTNSATVQPSDLQTGVTCFARGQKVTGTGKCFEFAEYGTIMSNFPMEVKSDVNVIEIASLSHPLRTLVALRSVKNMDFSTAKELAMVTVNGVEYAITVVVQDNTITLNCDQDLDLEIFYGRDRYI